MATAHALEQELAALLVLDAIGIAGCARRTEESAAPQPQLDHPARYIELQQPLPPHELSGKGGRAAHMSHDRKSICTVSRKSM